MGNTMQRRHFIKRLATRSGAPLPSAQENSPTVEKSLPPAATFKNTGIQSGINPYVGAWTEKEMTHLLKRVMFGATKASVDKIRSMSVGAAVDFLIDNPVQPDTTPVNNYTATADSTGVPYGNSWVTAGIPDPTDATMRNTLVNLRLSNSFKPWWMGQMINQKTHILEKITLFWSNHFGTDNVNNNRPKAIFQHYKILRTYGLTNFRDLLKQVTIDPHMLFFLSGNNSSKGAPNENYGRELQELFTVGKGPESKYTEDDVKAAAAVLAGWQVNPTSPAGLVPTDGTYVSYFSSARHENTKAKVFSAFYNNTKIGPKADGTEVDDLIDMILNTDECAKYLVRRLYTWFVYYKITADVETNVIAPLAAIFRTSNYSIPAVLKALFKSEHFFDAFNVGGIIKSPVDLYVGLIREFNIALANMPVDVQYSHWKFFSDRCNVEGQYIGDPPNVAGWPAYYVAETKFYETWMSPATIQIKAKNLATYSAKAGFKITATVTTGPVTLPLSISAASFLKQFPVSEAGDADIVIQKFTHYLLPAALSDEQVSFLRKKLIPDGEPDNYWMGQWNNYLTTPAANMAVADVLQTIVIYITGLAEYFLY